ncbi:MAG TPA: ATP-dependent protease subunit HslV [Bryobacteraceae bacterium]
MSLAKPAPRVRSTTILCVRRNGSVVMAGDGQVTLGDEVMKATAKKLRRLFNDSVLVGFAGSTADALALLARLDTKLEQHHGNLPRSVVDLAKDWRTDRALRSLQAFLIAADSETTFLVNGSGDVVEPEDGIAAIGSGGPIAKSAALALIRNTNLGARNVVEQSMKIAAETCIYTNAAITVEELPAVREVEPAPRKRRRT